MLLFFLLHFAFAETYFEKANQLYDKGNYKEAVRYYRAAIQEGRYEPFAWFNLGNSLVQLQKLELALVAYKRTVELMPQFTKAWVLMGDIYYLNDAKADAIVAYNRAMELGEDSEHIHYALAESFFKIGDYTLSQKHFERVLHFNPDRISAWYGLADIYERLEDYEMAIQTLYKAIDQSLISDPELYFTIASYYQNIDSLSKAIVAMEDGLLIDPQNTPARRYLAQMYIKANSPWMAIFSLEEGLRYNKEKSSILVDLGQIYFTQKRYPEAFESFLAAWNLGNPQGRIGAEKVGHHRYNMKDTKVAELFYKRIRDKQSNISF